MMTRRLQEHLAQAARQLGLRIVVGYVVQLQNGKSLSTAALFPDLGGALGTLVVDAEQELDTPTRKALLERGFSTSSFSEPLPNEEPDIAGYAEMFAEWGWTSGHHPKPPWMS